MAPRPRLRLSARSVVMTVVVIVLGISVLGLVAASARVLGWLAVACIAGGLLHPVVGALSRRIPRALALLIVVLGLVAPLAALAYGLVDQITDEASRLERVAPDAAERIEESERFGEAAREFELAERVRTFVDDIPERLRGGDPATALRSAATRGVAFLVTAVLTLFMILHGPALVTAGLAQIHDERRRTEVARVLAAGYRRAWWYVVLTLGRATAAGTFTWAICEMIEIPGSLVLGITVATFSLLPLVGVVVGGLTVVLLSLAVDSEATPLVAGLFLIYQVLEVFVVQRRLEARSVHVGPVVSLVAALIGFEVYGIGGLLVALAVAVFATGVLVELSPGDDEEPVPASAPAGLPGVPSAGDIATGDIATGNLARSVASEPAG